MEYNRVHNLRPHLSSPNFKKTKYVKKIYNGEMQTDVLGKSGYLPVHKVN